MIAGFFRNLVVLLAKTKVALALGAGAYFLAFGNRQPPPVFIVLTIAFAGAAYWLETTGRNERPLALSAVYWLTALPFAEAVLRLGYRNLRFGSLPAYVAESVRVEAFLPVALFAFFETFPGTVAHAPNKWAAVGQRVSIAAALVLAVATLVTGVLPSSPSWLTHLAAPSSTRSPEQTYFWIVLLVLTTAAFAAAAWMTQSARSEDRQRVRILVFSLAVGSGPLLIAVFLHRIPSVAEFLLQQPWKFVDNTLVYAGLLSIPLTTAYSIVSKQVLDVRAIVRTALRYSFARHATRFAMFAPFAFLAAYAIRHRDLPLSELFGDSRGTAVASLTFLAIVGHTKRESILNLLDRRFFREQYNAVEIIASLVKEARSCRSIDDLSALLHKELDRALHLHSFAFFVLRTEQNGLYEPKGRYPALLRSSQLGSMLKSAIHPIETSLDSPDSIFKNLPDPEKHWLVDTSATLLVAVLGTTSNLVGLMVLGDKKSGSAYSAEDASLLRTLALAIAPMVEQHLGREYTARPLACDGTVTATGLPPRLMNKFIIEREIGRGGMGVVYRAQDLELRRNVAIKTLPKLSPHLAVRLKREARSMAAVAHPNLASIFALETYGGIPLLICEYLEGGTLAQKLKQSPLSVTAAIHLGLTLAHALDAIHSAGLLHRDVKPSNIGYAGDGTAKLLDFGLAHALDASARRPAVFSGRSDELPTLSFSGTLTGGEIAGTPAYIAPEAWEGARYTVSVDLWALAVTLFESITGTNPFQRASHTATLFAILGPTPSIRHFKPDIAIEVDSVFNSLLSRNVDHRPRSASSFQQVLASLIPRNSSRADIS